MPHWNTNYARHQMGAEGTTAKQVPPGLWTTDGSHCSTVRQLLPDARWAPILYWCSKLGRYHNKVRTLHNITPCPLNTGAKNKRVNHSQNCGTLFKDGPVWRALLNKVDPPPNSFSCSHNSIKVVQTCTPSNC